MLDAAQMFSRRQSGIDKRAWNGLRLGLLDWIAMENDNAFQMLTEHDWLQIEQAASGCIDGTSDDWPHLRVAIEKVTGKPFGHRKCASWLRGFCEGVLIQAGRS